MSGTGGPDNEPPRDVLAAEEFAVPAPDPALTPEDLRLPSDLVGDEPRDVLVAEEFAMPAPDEARIPPPQASSERFPFLRVAGVNVAVALSGLWLWRRLRQR